MASKRDCDHASVFPHPSTWPSSLNGREAPALGAHLREVGGHGARNEPRVRGRAGLHGGHAPWTTGGLQWVTGDRGGDPHEVIPKSEMVGTN